MRSNPVKAALKSGGIVLGGEISRLASHEVARIYALAGYDFVFIDMEHTPFDLETVARMIETARAVKLVPLVRVPQAEYAWVSRVLDAGAMGIIVPRVNTPEQVRSLVSWTRYPPLGIRGFACTHFQNEDREVPPDDFMRAVHEHTLLVIQIERREALANLSEMVSIAGVDVACLGYMDLSVDMGIAGQVAHPDMVAAIQRLIDVSQQHSVAPGIICAEIDVVMDWMHRGMRFVSYSSDGRLLLEAAKSAMMRLRSACKR